MQRPSYVGVCDVQSRSGAIELVEYFKECLFPFPVQNTKLMIGLMMSRKTLRGIPSKYTNVWLKNDEVGDVFVKDDCVINCVHYADYNDSTIIQDLEDVVKYGGPNLNAVQFDMVWPNTRMIRVFKDKFPYLSLVLQVSKEAMFVSDNNPKSVANKLKDYGDSLDYVLFDRSGGRGIPISYDELEPYILAMQSINRNTFDANIALAGGLTPSNLQGFFNSFISLVPNLSCDAEGGMRKSFDNTNPIDYNIAKSFISNFLFNAFYINLARERRVK